MKVDEVIKEKELPVVEANQDNVQLGMDDLDLSPDSMEKDEITIDDQLSKIVEKVAVQAKKEEELVYVGPPEYDNLGRGLVYNCVGKHWACVDKISYLKCNKNKKWNKNNKKNMECVTNEIYATEDDCRKIQIHNINTVKETKFCTK